MSQIHGEVEMDIGALTECLPAKELSNFTAREFAVDGVPCASMEGFLQALKEPDPVIQREMCLLVGFAAKKRGRKLDLTWKARQTLWWQGQEFGRRSEEFQGLLDRAFEALFNHERRFPPVARSHGTRTSDALDRQVRSVGHGSDRRGVLYKVDEAARTSRQ